MEFKYDILKITSNEYKTMPIMNITYGRADSRFGNCVMGTNEDRLCFVYFGDFNTGFQKLIEEFPNANLTLNDALVAEKTKLFAPNATGDIKLLLKGTEFQMRVWEHLVCIQKGKTTCYEEVAKGIGSQKSVRAVANAVAKNKIAFFVPCHRVISKNGDLNKFKWGIDIKRKILFQEKKIFSAKRKFIDAIWAHTKIKVENEVVEILEEDVARDIET